MNTLDTLRNMAANLRAMSEQVRFDAVAVRDYSKYDAAYQEYKNAVHALASANVGKQLVYRNEMGTVCYARIVGPAYNAEIAYSNPAIIGIGAVGPNEIIEIR